MVLICIFLIISIVKHLCIRLLSTVHLWEKGQVFCTFKSGGFVVVAIVYLQDFYVLKGSPLLDT